MAAIWVVASVVLLAASAQAQCDLQQQVAVGVYYDISSPNYPAKYSPGTTCRWRAYTDTGNRLQLNCGVFELPQSSNCQSDRVSVSPTGDDTLADAHVYCGTGSFSVQSDTERLTMVLQSTYYSTGGRFLCNITAVRAAPTCQCGMKKETRIVGGQETGINEFPFMAALVDASIREIVCGATIISKHYALTAAHCTVNRDVANVGLLVGDHDITTGSETSAAYLYRVERFVVHEFYNQGGTVDQDNDIALARIAEGITMSREVMPACLPFRFQSFTFQGQTVEVTGWGTTSFGGQMSNVLLKANLDILSQSQCSAVYGNTVSYNQMCTFREGKDACQSDSGGPLFWRDMSTGLIHVIGVVSHGIACATSSPGVNTRVTSYLTWITSKIAEDQYCIN